MAMRLASLHMLLASAQRIDHMLDRTLIVMMFAAAIFAGCAAEVPVGRPTLDQSAAEARASEIGSRAISRAGVHELLGEPWLASAPLGVEVYRLAGKQRNVGVIFAPYPVPVPFLSDKLVTYTLVTYDAEGLVVAKDFSFLHAAPGEWPGLMLRAGDFEFVHAPQDTLSVTLDRFLQAQAAGSTEPACTILVGCDVAPVIATAAGGLCTCAANMYLDEGKRLSLILTRPLFQPGSTISVTECNQLGGYVRALAGRDPSACQLTPQLWRPQSLAPGQHKLRFALSRSDPGITSELTCRPGEVTLVTLAGHFMECQRDGQLPTRRRKAGPGDTAVLSPEVPAELRVVVYDNGRWLFPWTQTIP